MKLSQEQLKEYIHAVVFKPVGMNEVPCQFNPLRQKFLGKVGLEIEMLPLISQTAPQQGLKVARLASLTTKDAPPFSYDILRQNAHKISAKIEEQDEFKDLKGQPGLKTLTLSNRGNISFEPGGQIEYSSAPRKTLNEALSEVEKIQNHFLDPEFSKQGIHFFQTGMNLFQTPEEIGLQVPKKRYMAMNDFYKRISSYGQRMMRQTCTIQVNLDFVHCPDELPFRYLVSQLLAPFASAMFANSPWIDEKGTYYESFRDKTWQHVSPKASGFPDLSSLLKKFCLDCAADAYLEFALNAPVVFFTERDYEVAPENFSFKKWIDEGFHGLAPTLADFETHLTLLFPEVRPRGFIEFRSIDCQHRVWQSVPAVFLVVLMYDDIALDQVYSLLVEDAPHLFTRRTEAAFGLKEENIFKKVLKLCEIAQNALERFPETYIDKRYRQTFDTFINTFTRMRLTPGGHFYQLNHDHFKAGQSLRTDFNVLQRVSELWQNKNMKAS